MKNQKSFYPLLAALAISSGAIFLGTITGCEQSKPEQPVVIQNEQPAPPPKSDGMLHFTHAYPTGNATTSVVEVEKILPASAVAGQRYTYSLVVRNLTDEKLTDVIVVEQIGYNTQLASSTPEGTISGGIMRVNLGTMSGREVKTIRVTAMAPATGMSGTCTTLDYNAGLCAMLPVVQPKLTLTTSAPSEVLLCETIPLKFVVTNPGSGSASNVVINSDLPAGLITADGKSRISFNVGTLASGASREITFPTKASHPGAYESKGLATGDIGLKAESSSATTIVRQPVLAISTNGPEKVYIGRQIPYEITVTNQGDGVAKNAMVVDTLPTYAQVAGVSQGGTYGEGRVRWALGDLAPKSSRTLAMTLNSGSEGSYENSAVVTGDCAAAASSAKKTAVIGIPGILLETRDDPDPVQVGSTTTYTISVTNQGSTAITNVKLVATLEPTEEFIGEGGVVPAQVNGPTITFSPISSLAPKARATVTVKVKAVKAGEARFHVRMTNDMLQRPVDHEESTNLYE